MSVYPQPGVTVIQPGYGPPPGYGPAQPQTNVTVGYAPPPVQQTHVVTIQQPTTAVPGTCRGCGSGTFRGSPTAFGICCAILFFPFGIIFCLLDLEKRCTVCGLTYR